MKNETSIIQNKISKDKIDSFWYDGAIASKGEYHLIASGAIKIVESDKDGNYVGMFDGKVRDDFTMPKNDKELSEMFNNNDKYFVDMNNWFEIYGIDEQGEVIDVIGDVAYDYDEAMDMLETYYKDDTLEINNK